MNRPDCLYIVIPCYNEEQVLPVTSGMFLDELNHLIKAGKISSDSRIMFVNDGSSDSTWDIITDLSKKDKHFIGISQSRNRGHQSSVLAGKSHYPFSKMLNLALNGITSLSVKPLRLVMSLGIIVSILSFIGVIWAVVDNLLGNTVTGWASTVCIVCFMGGIQLMCLGVIGEYIGKIYMEVKNRPRFIISERTYECNEDEKS